MALLEISARQDERGPQNCFGDSQGTRDHDVDEEEARRERLDQHRIALELVDSRARG